MELYDKFCGEFVMVHYINRRVEVFKKLKDNTWDSDGIVLNYVKNIKVNKGIGKKIDTFNFVASNYDNRLFQQEFDGDGSITSFALDYYPSSAYLSDWSGDNSVYKVIVDDATHSYVSSGPGSDEYTLNGGSLVFGSAPGVGTRNVEVRFEVISADDIVDIYIWKDTDSYTNSDLIIEGVVSEPNSDGAQDQKFLSVRGKGLIETVMSSLVFLKPNSVKPVHRLIQDVIDEINGYNTGARAIFGGKGSGKADGDWDTIGNPVLKSDKVTSFPNKNYSSSYKSALEVIEELSSDEYTEDGQYVFWVDYNPTRDTYDFVWRSKDIDASGTLAQGVSNSTYEPLVSQAARRVDDVVNFVIYNVGPNCEEISHDYLYADFSSVSSVGGRWLYHTDTSNISPDLVDGEFNVNNSYWDTDNNGKRVDNYPLLSGGTWGNGSATWTFQFQGRDSNTGSQTGSSATCGATLKAFNEVIDVEAEYRGKGVAKKLVDLYSNPRVEGECSLVFTNTFALGEVYGFTFRGFGLYDKRLRVDEIEYDFWNTHIKLKEDDKTVEGEL